MKSAHRSAKLALGLATGLALALSTTSPATAATGTANGTANGTATGASSAHAAATWRLSASGQRICATASGGHAGAYFFAPIVGTWSTNITVGIRNLPPGSFSRGGSTIPPGSNPDGPSIIVNGFVGVSIAPAPAGLYTPEVWATDGVETQAVPVKIYLTDDSVSCGPV